MFAFTLTIEDDTLLVELENLRQEAPRMASAATWKVREAISDILYTDLFTFVPGPVVYPIRWTPSRHPEDRRKKPNTRWGYYSRQKAAFFATNGFGRGIPSSRHQPPEVNQAWNVQAVPLGEDGALLEVTNAAEHFPFVIGDPTRPTWQQQFHANTGWLRPDEVQETLQQAAEDALAMLRRLWLETVTEFVYGGVTTPKGHRAPSARKQRMAVQLGPESEIRRQVYVSPYR